MKVILLIFIINAFATTADSQEYAIAGKVTDSISQKALNYATVAVYKNNDSAVVNGTITNSEGAFKIAVAKEGTYYLLIKFIGYHSKRISNIIIEKNKKINVGIIALAGSEQLLQAVTVQGNTAIYSNIEKQVFKASQFQNAQGATATDVIKNLPAVSINLQGEIVVRGSGGFLLLLDGKPVQGSAEDILAHIPANAIENIEVITAPSAKYDADGKGGIINIITKKGATNGLSITVNSQGGLPRINNYNNKENPQRYSADATINYKKSKWDITLGGNYLRNDIASKREGDAYTIIDNVFTHFPSIGERSFKRYSYAARASVNFSPDKNNTFSAGFFNGGKTQYRLADLIYNNSKTSLLNSAIIEQLSYYNSNLVKRYGNFTLGNFDYAHSFQNKSTLSASVLYEHDDFNGFTKNNNLYSPASNDTIQYTINTSNSSLNAYRFKIDYAVNIGTGKWESGYQLRYQQQPGNFLYRQAIIGTKEFTVFPLFSDNTTVKSSVNALYSQYSGKVNNLTYAAGIRYEYAKRSFTAGKLADDFKLNLSDFFPSVNLLYALPENWSLKGGYSRRVDRSTSNELNPYPEREHSETLEQGDPKLLPEYTGIAEAGIAKTFAKGSVFFTVYHQDIKNIVNRVNKIYNDSILYRIYTNAGRASLWGAEGGATVKLAKWWQAYLGGNVYHLQIKGSLFDNNVEVNNQGYTYSINTNQRFIFSPSCSVQASLNYLSQKVAAQGEDSRFFLPALSAKKSFDNNRIAATFQWQNIAFGNMKTNQQRITTSGAGFYTSTNYIQEVNIFFIGVSYKLNGASAKSKLPASEFGEKEF